VTNRIRLQETPDNRIVSPSKDVGQASLGRDRSCESVLIVVALVVAAVAEKRRDLPHRSSSRCAFSIVAGWIPRASYSSISSDDNLSGDTTAPGTIDGELLPIGTSDASFAGSTQSYTPTFAAFLDKSLGTKRFFVQSF